MQSYPQGTAVPESLLVLLSFNILFVGTAALLVVYGEVSVGV